MKRKGLKIITIPIKYLCDVLMSKDNIINGEELKIFLREAKALVALYDEGNRKNPHNFYNYGSIDKVMLRLLEDRKGFITIGIKLYGDDIKILGRVGHLSADGRFLFAENQTVEYRLKDFEGGTTVSTFAKSISEIVGERHDSGIPELREIMLPNAKAYAARTRQETSPYSR